MKRLGILILSLSLTVYIAAQQTGTFIDSRDGQMYKWVKIGEQVWMAENLNYKTNSGSWCYDNDLYFCKKYGRLYNWETAMKVCPDGWHLPSDNEWTKLVNYLGGEEVAGEKLKSASGWRLYEGKNYGNNESGFSALPGGNRLYNGTFYSIGYYGFWWSSTEHSSTSAWYRYNYSSVSRSSSHKDNGFSVRCLRDN